MSSVGGWVQVLHLDTADTFAWNSGNLDVSRVSPAGAPGVSDDPVVLAILCAESDSTDGVIELGTAAGIVQDSTSVHLEAQLVSLDGQSDWRFGDSCLELVNAVGWNVSVAGIFYFSVGLACNASSADSMAGGVWVYRLSYLSVLHKVHESVCLETTIAAHGVGVAGNELLLREG